MHDLHDITKRFGHYFQIGLSDAQIFQSGVFCADRTDYMTMHCQYVAYCTVVTPCGRSNAYYAMHDFIQQISYCMGFSRATRCYWHSGDVDPSGSTSLLCQ